MNITSPVIDFHAHVLPFADHGCRSADECFRQLSIIRKMGTEIVVATPHFYPHVHTVGDFSTKIKNSLSILKSLNIQYSPKLCIGAEVLLCDNLGSMEGLEALCVKGTKVLLLELPLKELKKTQYDTVEELISAGYTVILVHIDRYLKKYSAGVHTMLEIGAYAQINADALWHFGIRRSILSIFEHEELSDRICSIGSDLHRTDIHTYRKFVGAGRYIKDYYETVMQRSASLLKNAEMINL